MIMLPREKANQEMDFNLIVKIKQGELSLHRMRLPSMKIRQISFAPLLEAENLRFIDLFIMSTREREKMIR